MSNNNKVRTQAQGREAQEKALNEALVSIAAHERRIGTAEAELRYLRQEAKKGTPGVTKKIAEMSNAITTQQALVERMAAEIKDIKSSDNPIIAQRNLGGIQSVMDRLEALEDLDAKVQKIREDVTALQADVTSLNVRTSNNENNIERIDASHNRLTHRVFNLENIQEKAPWVALLVGAIAGVIAYFMWFNLVPWKSVIELPDGSEIPVTYDALHFGGSWLVAIAAGALVAGLIIAYTRKRSASYRDDDVEQTRVYTNHPSPTPRRIADDDAPTKVLVTEGAPSGTR